MAVTCCSDPHDRLGAVGRLERKARAAVVDWMRGTAGVRAGHGRCGAGRCARDEKVNARERRCKRGCGREYGVRVSGSMEGMTARLIALRGGATAGGWLHSVSAGGQSQAKAVRARRHPQPSSAAPAHMVPVVIRQPASLPTRLGCQEAVTNGTKL